MARYFIDDADADDISMPALGHQATKAATHPISTGGARGHAMALPAGRRD